MAEQSTNWTEQVAGDAVLLRASGRIDLSNAEAFTGALTAAMSKAKSALIVDFAAVDYISSAGLRALMIAFKAGKPEGKALAVAALQPLLKEIFTISRFNLVFPMFDTVRQAVEKLAPSSAGTLGAP
jgi:anti-sigma B factor antagonist/stage II sporulation protein AA (anti-sigma F factor antagonist)